MKHETTAARAPLPRRETNVGPAIRAVIVVQGLVTVALVLMFLPAGIVAVLANAVLAFVTGGIERRLFATFAVVGALASVAIGLGLISVGASGVTRVVPVG